jgi:hypothetical protein
MHSKHRHPTKTVDHSGFVSGHGFTGCGKALLAAQVLKGHDFSGAANATK